MIPLIVYGISRSKELQGKEFDSEDNWLIIEYCKLICALVLVHNKMKQDFMPAS